MTLRSPGRRGAPSAAPVAGIAGTTWRRPRAPAEPAERRTAGAALPRCAAGRQPARAAIIRAAGAAPPRGRSGFAASVFVLILLAAAVASAYFGRQPIVAFWPPAARLYELAGLGAEGPGEGLDIANVTSTRNVDGLIVEGDITDKVGTPRAVPRLRVVLRDAARNEVAVKIVEPPKPRLLPGETAHFVVAFMPASEAAVEARVTFVAG